MIKVGIMKRNAKTVVDGCQTRGRLGSDNSRQGQQGHKAPAKSIKPIKPAKLTKPLCHFAWLGRRSFRLQ